MKVEYKFPTTKDFIKLFESNGWERKERRVDENRENSCFAVSIYDNNEIVGMGRVVGDGAYFTVFDVVVEKSRQGRGIGSLVMQEIVKWYKNIEDDDTFLYLNASKGKESFYEQFGFRIRPNEHLGAGMKWQNE